MFKKPSGTTAAPVDPTPNARPRTDRPRMLAPEKGGPNGRLTVGPDIRLIGASIEDCDTLIVEGRVEASMDSRVIQIAESGTFVGSAAVDEAEINGRFDGELTVRDRLSVHKTGRISGTVRYGRLAVEEGGELAGDVASIRDGEKTNVVAGPAPSGAEKTPGTPATDSEAEAEPKKSTAAS